MQREVSSSLSYPMVHQDVPDFCIEMRTCTIRWLIDLRGIAILLKLVPAHPCLTMFTPYVLSVAPFVLAVDHCVVREASVAQIIDMRSCEIFVGLCRRGFAFLIAAANNRHC